VSAPDSDEKSRFTSMQTGDAKLKGEMLSSFNVVKCSTKANDYRTHACRVLKAMHTK
jgi:hypothetical protein